MPSRAELTFTRDAMRSRGPDDAGDWASTGDRCLLGHRRLSIIDLAERARQPMVSADRTHVVTFNGEIYNYPELRVELEAKGVNFRTSSDTEVLLHLYRLEGAAMVTRLRGMFAFAIWDVAAERLFLARDPYGIKPLYIADSGGTFRFASQVKALIAGGKISREKAAAGIVGFYLLGSVPEPFTIFNAVRALPAGHSLWVDSNGPHEPVRYHNIAAVFASAARRPIDGSELGELVRETVRSSVAAHMLADVEVGIFLSAGIDSGALLGLVSELGRGRVRTITLGFEEFTGTPEDEVPLAAEVASHYGAEHIVRRVGEAEFRHDLDAIFAAMDQPSIDGINTWFVSKAAQEAGLKVALSGLGSDELLAGYPSFVDVPRWKRRFGHFSMIPGSGPLLRNVLKRTCPRFALENPKALGILDHSGTWGGAYLLRRGLFLPEELAGLVCPELLREGLERLRPIELLEAALAPDPGSDVARVSTLESSFYMRNQLLRDADWAGMAHSLEIRVPLVDSVVLASLAGAVHGVRYGSGKRALAAAPSVALPAHVANRRKSGFGVPTGRWITGSPSFRGASSPPSKGLASRNWSKLVLEAALAN
jgi:asparagine synthase (glutamine-hydrolysing)